MIGTVAAGRRRAAGDGGGGTPTPPPFSDTFNGVFNDAWNGPWPNSFGGPVTSGGRLRLACTSSYPTAQSDNVYDLTQYPIHIEMPAVPAVGNGGTQTQFLVSNGSGSNGGFELNGATLKMQGTGITMTSVAYDATAHRWLRLSVAGGNFVWETSPDKTTWTVRKSVAAPSWVTAGLLRAFLSCGYFGSETAPGYAEFDNFNA